jgi:hypothetical protein
MSTKMGRNNKREREREREGERVGNASVKVTPKKKMSLTNLTLGLILIRLYKVNWTTIKRQLQRFSADNLQVDPMHSRNRERVKNKLTSIMICATLVVIGKCVIICEHQSRFGSSKSVSFSFNF